MIDRKVQMMDAGMVLLTSVKPFGTVLGGVKAELAGLGNVRRSSEISHEDLPDTTGDCDLFVDWSTPLRWRAIACRLEDAGFAGVNPDGEEIRRYALCVKEGNKNRKGKVTAVLLIVALLLFAGISGIAGIPRMISVPVAAVIATFWVVLCLRPSVKSQDEVKRLLSVARDAT